MSVQIVLEGHFQIRQALSVARHAQATQHVLAVPLLLPRVAQRVTLCASVHRGCTDLMVHALSVQGLVAVAQSIAAPQVDGCAAMLEHTLKMESQTHVKSVNQERMAQEEQQHAPDVKMA